jgi:GDPmannose 4,6-dehydratase
MFGPDAPSPQDEAAPLDPRTIYAIAKAAGMQLVRLYREEKGLRACSGILFNHESPRRGAEFVTRKITMGAACIKLGLVNELRLGDLAARRDWGHARSFASAMRLMVHREQPEDLVLATGQTHCVRDFAEVAFAHLGLDYRQFVVEDPGIPRPSRAGLVGNPARAQAVLGWRDEIPFRRLVEEMTDVDLKRAQTELSARRTNGPPAAGGEG